MSSKGICCLKQRVLLITLIAIQQMVVKPGFMLIWMELAMATHQIRLAA
jgi:hypothetical protein